MSDTPVETAAALDDRATLHRLGYAQELYRSMGGFQNFAISFTIISILAGCLTSYSIGFNQGGPVAITWGWLIVGLACTFVAMAGKSCTRCSIFWRASTTAGYRTRSSEARGRHGRPTLPRLAEPGAASSKRH